MMLLQKDLCTSTTSDRSDGEFSPPLVVTRWRKRQKLHTAFSLLFFLFAPSVHL